MKIGLFIPCYVDVVYPEVGVATYKLLKHLGLDVDYPLNQTCCGQPQANAGFEDMAVSHAEHFEELFKEYVRHHGVRRILRGCDTSRPSGSVHRVYRAG